MLRPGEYADILRAIGQTLDNLTAASADIVQNEDSIVVSWVSPQGAQSDRTYGETDVNALRIVAREVRNGVGKWQSGDYAEKLRTLGQSLDRQGITLDRIAEHGEGFRVTGSTGGRFVSQWYTAAGLSATSAERRAARDAPAPPRPPASPRDQEHLSRRRIVSR